jgi:hypothetical protein
MHDNICTNSLVTAKKLSSITHIFAHMCLTFCVELLFGFLGSDCGRIRQIIPAMCIRAEVFLLPACGQSLGSWTHGFGYIWGWRPQTPILIFAPFQTVTHRLRHFKHWTVKYPFYELIRVISAPWVSFSLMFMNFYYNLDT